jgi:antitoxin component of MazEF toxin-antitoxin module
MAPLTRKVDTKGRVVLPEEFAGQTVKLEVVGEGHVSVRIAKPPRKRPSLNELLSRITKKNRPEPVEFGAPVGDELL